VAITSAVGGEGKTTLASHLAISVARTGRNVLLVDCDLRRPTVHRLFDLPLEGGVADLLRGEAQAFEVLRPTAIGRLTICTGGQNDAASLQALAQGHLAWPIERFKEQFDLVIVDTAPILPVADTLEISRLVDAVVFAVLRDVSRIPMVDSAYHRLRALGVPVLGAVMAGTPVGGQGYSYVNELYGRYPRDLDDQSHRLAPARTDRPAEGPAAGAES
jgi:capsular exopolysaccharide synthesis family protein